MRKNDIKFFTGCMVGGAVGDALGAPVEGMSLEEIKENFGPSGITRFEEIYDRRGAITDDTQMSLFTAEGLVISGTRCRDDLAMVPEFLHHAYLRWYSTQMVQERDSLIGSHGTCSIVDGILTGYPEMNAWRGPGRTCLTSLASGVKGTIENPINNSKGCGGIMRAAPVGLFFSPERAFHIGCQSAAITHGHPSGYLAAGCLAHIVSEIIYNNLNIEEAVQSSFSVLQQQKNSGECIEAVQKALKAVENRNATPEAVEGIGSGWIAEEALAISIYCALTAEGNFRKGALLAVNHGGDSDSTGAITGNILGAALGIDAIGADFIQDIELYDLIIEMADDIFQIGYAGR